MGEPVTIMTAVSAAVGAIQSAAQQRAQARVQNEAAERQIAEQQMAREQAEKKARDDAKAQQARARASFGARGVSSAGGSANALIDGISSRTEEAIAENRQLSDFGIESLRANQQARQRESLLQTRNSLMNTVVNTGGQQILSALEKE
jgi:hypothetical protein